MLIDMRIGILLLGLALVVAARTAVAEEPPAPGWDAIDHRLQALYGKVEPKHYAPPLPPALSGKLLNGVSVYRSKAGDHWHYVTYGFSDLYEKSDPGSSRSGYGFELTFRLKAGSESEAPIWAVNLIYNIADYVGKSGNGFAPGHHMDANGPLKQAATTKITAIIFALDPELGEIPTPHGTVQFLQMVGVTREEYRLAIDWSSAGVLEMLGRNNPLLTTDLDRGSVLDQPALAQEALARQSADGSSQGATLLESLNVTVTEMPTRRLLIEVSGGARESLSQLLRSRICKSKSLDLVGKKHTVKLTPGTSSSWQFNGDSIAVSLTPDAAMEVSKDLAVARSSYSWASVPGLELRFAPLK